MSTSLTAADDGLGEWVAESREASGVPRHVTDGPTLDRVITLLGLDKPAAASTSSAGGSAAAAAGGVDGAAGVPLGEVPAPAAPPSAVRAKSQPGLVRSPRAKAGARTAASKSKKPAAGADTPMAAGSH